MAAQTRSDPKPRRSRPEARSRISSQIVAGRLTNTHVSARRIPKPKLPVEGGDDLITMSPRTDGTNLRNKIRMSRTRGVFPRRR